MPAIASCFRIIVPVIFFLVLILCSGCSAGEKTRPAAHNGVIDLRLYDFSLTPVTPLDGEWEFYWKQLLSPEELNQDGGYRVKQYVPVPSTWSDLASKGFGTEPGGYGTYRIKILLPEKSGIYGIHIFSLMSAYKIWADGELIAEAGRVGVSDELMEHKWLPGEYYFQSSSGEVEIVIQISNFRCEIGGFWTPAGFGYAADISSMRMSRISFDNFLIGILLMLAFYHLGFYIFQRKEKSAFWFGIFCVIMAVRILALGEQRLLYQLISFSWDIPYRIEMLSFYLAGGVFYFFLRTIYPDESFNAVERITRVVMIVTAAAAAVLPTLLVGRIINFYIFLTIFYIITAMVMLVKALVKGREGSAIFMIGIVTLLVFALNDMMNLLGLMHSGFYIHAGFMVFVSAQSFIMLRRFATSFVNNENLTQELEAVNITLEEKVEARTRELENERNILREQSSVMDDELKMARSIQRRIIPVKSPYSNIAFYYRPMKRVGGDFFDFIKMRENSIGILISDVSGHGVPAALITSMLKSFVLQSGEKKQDPGQLMTYLNDSLIDHTADNFITAFYCIYTPGDKKLVYCNAGHPLPYIISEHGVENISSVKRNPPLAIIRSNELAGNNKNYSNSSIILNKGDRLFLYTDGLTEARAGKYTIDMFGDSDLESVLYENRKMPIDKFLPVINSKLVEYCQSENLEDDICMICIDI